MKKWFFSLLILLLLLGCASKESNNDIFQYKDSLVGNNSAVGNIANQLLGAEQLTNFELKTDKEPYGIIFNYDWTESEQKFKEMTIYNATFLFALIQNVDWITFHSNIGEYTITKENLQRWYGKEFRDIEREEELKEMLRIKTNENNVNLLLK